MNSCKRLINYCINNVVINTTHLDDVEVITIAFAYMSLWDGLKYFGTDNHCVNEDIEVDEPNVLVGATPKAISAGTNSIYVEDLTVDVSKWVKLIDFDRAIAFDKYDRAHSFKLVANVVCDDGLRTNGKKKRASVIKFEPCISETEFTRKSEWLYLMTINGRIVKIGGTRTGLKNRTQSYLTGHHTLERGKSGSCSSTNAYVYNTFDHYLALGYKIALYGYLLPTARVSITVFKKRIDIGAQTYHAYESMFMEDYARAYGAIPQLCDNSDPEFRKLITSAKD